MRSAVAGTSAQPLSVCGAIASAAEVPAQMMSACTTNRPMLAGLRRTNRRGRQQCAERAAAILDDQADLPVDGQQRDARQQHDGHRPDVRVSHARGESEVDPGVEQTR